MLLMNVLYSEAMCCTKHCCKRNRRNIIFDFEQARKTSKQQKNSQAKNQKLEAHRRNVSLLNTTMATMAMLAGVEPRPSSNRSKAVSPQRRHLGISRESSSNPISKNNTDFIGHNTRRIGAVSNPSQSMEPPHGDKSYQRQQVEKLGFRYHQNRFSSRGHGQYRSAETHNDLRTVLANVVNPKFSKPKFQKRMFRNDANQRSHQHSTTTSKSHYVEPAVLDSSGVAAAFTTYRPPVEKGTGGALVQNSETAKTTTASTQQNIATIQVQDGGNRTAQASDVAAITPRVQPSMVSTLPIGWEQGSSWNVASGNRWETSGQRQNEGKQVAEHSLNNRRIPRDPGKRSVSTSQIVFG